MQYFDDPTFNFSLQCLSGREFVNFNKNFIKRYWSKSASIKTLDSGGHLWRWQYQEKTRTKPSMFRRPYGKRHRPTDNTCLQKQYIMKLINKKKVTFTLTIYCVCILKSSNESYKPQFTPNNDIFRILFFPTFIRWFSKLQM